MTPEAQRIAIAEACGWVAIEQLKEGFDSRRWEFYTMEPNGYPDDNEISVGDWVGKYNPEAKLQALPDYLNDLNAMHEVEKVLSRGVGYHQPGGFGRYKTLLAEVCGEQRPIDATAAQRAEAFLRTNGKWEESK